VSKALRLLPMRVLAFIALGFLSACASVYDEPVQIIEVGLSEGGPVQAKCYFENKNIKHVFFAPGTVSVQRSPNPLYAYCLTANGKEAFQTIHPKFSELEQYNIMNAGLGFIHDYASDTAFAYPDYVELDFQSVKTIIHDVPPAKTYSETVLEEHEKEREAIIERARRVLSQGEKFPVKTDIKN